MPQGPLRQILMPPPVQQGPPVQLDQTPLAQTNPGLARLVDFFGGLMGVKDALDPQSSNATMAGAGMSAALPFMGALGTLKQIGSAAKTEARLLPRVRTSATLPGPRGSLAETLERDAAGVYHIKPDVQERMHQFYERGAGVPSNWEGSNEELLTAFGGDADAARQWARMWGATSPNTSVPRNTAESISAHLWKLENPGQAMTVEQARGLTPNITMAPSKVPNINRAISGEPLSGDKVEAMAGYMVGDPRTPIDVHVLYGVGAKNDKLTEEVPALRALMTKLEQLPKRG